LPKYEDACPEIRELDVYTGCPYGCAYCIGRDRHRKPSRLHESYDGFMRTGSSDVPLYLSPWTDPYPPEEEDLGHTGRLLEHLAATGQPFYVVTKSPLVLRDAGYFRGRDDRFIAVSLNTVDDRITGLLEPDAPSASVRMKLVEDLVALGDVRTVVRVDPVVPTLTDGIALDRTLDWLCRVRPFAAAFETLRLNTGICGNMADVLPQETYQSIVSSYAGIGSEAVHPRMQWRRILFRWAAARLAECGMRACFCRATLPDRITPWDCRGGY
jgi:DNA repair photolyase